MLVTIGRVGTGTPDVFAHHNWNDQVLDPTSDHRINFHVLACFNSVPQTCVRVGFRGNLPQATGLFVGCLFDRFFKANFNLPVAERLPSKILKILILNLPFGNYEKGEEAVG